jgi:hypothetical protein
VYTYLKGRNMDEEEEENNSVGDFRYVGIGK